MATAFVAVYLTFEQAQQVDCQAQYNARVAAYDASRAESAQRDRDALRGMIHALLDSPTGFREEAQRYLDTVERSDRERAATPVVPPPADLCS